MISTNGTAALLPNHLRDLAKSGLDAADAHAAGIYSESDPAEIARLLRWKHPARRLRACLCFTFRRPDGSTLVRVKPDRPRVKSGREIKYESPIGSGLFLYFHPGVYEGLVDGSITEVAIVEGEKKALAGWKHGLACIGILGADCWSEPRPKGPNGKRVGPRRLLKELADVLRPGLRVYVILDSDVATKRSVQKAEAALVKALARRMVDVRVVRFPDGLDGPDGHTPSKIGLDDFLVGLGPGARAGLQQLLKQATKPKKARPKKSKPSPPVQELAAIGLAMDLWHDQADCAFVSLGRQSYPVKSKFFRFYLVNQHRKATAQVVNSGMLADALATIEAQAVHDGPERPASVRVAEHGGTVYLHLADKDSTVIAIDAGGWRPCEKPPVWFVRHPGMLALPPPQRGGSIQDLRPFVNVADDADFALLKAWIAGCFRPSGPFPVLGLFGEQGSAKSTTAKAVKLLIDPKAAAIRSQPRETRDLMISAQKSWVLNFDNLSWIPDWLSDDFCRLATGGGFAVRELYTDADEVIFDAKRPLVVNGVEDFVTRADLMERTLLIRHPTIAEDRRKVESELWAAFDAARPKLLGAVLDRVAAGLRELPGMRPERLPRMADFARFAVACEKGVGEKEVFLNAYFANQSEGHATAMEASPIPPVLIKLMEKRTTWQGTPTELLEELTKLASEETRKAKGWPKQSNILTNKLRRLAPNLRRVHKLDCDCDVKLGDTNNTRNVRICRPDSGGKTSSEPSEPSEPSEGPFRTVPGGTDRPPGQPPHNPEESELIANRNRVSDGSDGSDGHLPPSGARPSEAPSEPPRGPSEPDSPDLAGMSSSEPSRPSDADFDPDEIDRVSEVTDDDFEPRKPHFEPRKPPGTWPY